ncbi:hypothetical protein [Ruegeria jejuensis]|uniref:hypothetical protein n=1 Tax=Ruegeria jejuensis TaxID=3233338 RepID=UPI00355C1AFC
MDHLFEKLEGGYIPSSYTAGPFGNIQGGAAASIMATVAIENAPKGYIPVSQRTELLHSTPLAHLNVELSTLKEGAAHRVVEAQILNRQSRRSTARSTIAFYKPTPIAELTPAEIKPWGGFADPNTLSDVPRMASPSGQKEWMLNATVVRADMKGTYWFRWNGPLLSDGSSHWFAQLLGPSDWVGGFIAPGFPSFKVGPWPNTDLTVQVNRPMAGEWIGLRPKGLYRETGFGLGQGALIDQDGVFGHAMASTISPAR